MTSPAKKRPPQWINRAVELVVEKLKVSERRACRVLMQPRSTQRKKKAEILELNMQDDHIHLVLSIPPKVSISEMMGLLKGKTAIKLFKSYPELKKKPYLGNYF